MARFTPGFYFKIMDTFFSFISALGVLVAVWAAGYTAGRSAQKKQDKKKIQELEELVKKGIEVSWINPDGTRLKL